VIAVVGFGSSSRLANAYGVAVMGTMLITTLLTFVVIRYEWRYPLLLCVAVTGFFAILDSTFLAAALHKLLDGGWMPIALGAAMFTLMATWRRGRDLLLDQLRESSVPLTPFIQSLFVEPPQLVPGTAVFLTSAPDATPHALLHSLKHYKVLHERNVFLTVDFLDRPWLDKGQHVKCEELGHGCWRVVARCGFMELPDILEALGRCKKHGLDIEPMDVSFFLSREKVVAGAADHGMARWRDRIFAAMARNAGSVSDFFNIPANRVVELGTRIEI
jgi:KUP system potassium uptake protein